MDCGLRTGYKIWTEGGLRYKTRTTDHGLRTGDKTRTKVKNADST